VSWRILLNSTAWETCVKPDATRRTNITASQKISSWLKMVAGMQTCGHISTCGYTLEITKVSALYDSFSFKTASIFLSLLLPACATNLPVSNQQGFSSPITTQHSHRVFSSKLPLHLILGIISSPASSFLNVFSSRVTPAILMNRLQLKRVYKDVLIHVDYTQVPVLKAPIFLTSSEHGVQSFWKSLFEVSGFPI
jgi:hypothetical protein